MAERSKKISELQALASASGDDLLLVVDQPGTANASSNKITVANFFANVSTNTVFKTTLTTNTVFVSISNSAPSSASDSGTQGELRIANDYIYVCISSNTWVRAELTTW